MGLRQEEESVDLQALRPISHNGCMSVTAYLH